MNSGTIDLDNLKNVKKCFKNTTALIVTAILLIIAVVIIFNSFYILKSGEVGIVTRFGKLHSTVTVAGFKVILPFVDKVDKVNIAEVRRYEYGYTTVEAKNGQAKYEENGQTTLMLTSDECLVNVEASIQYKIVEPYLYLFNVDEQDKTLSIISESTLRRGIASHKLDEVLTDNKSGIQQEIKDDLQKICNKYNLGIQITGVQLQDINPPSSVEAAFKDVAGALEDKNSYINEANSYKNEVIPLARGSATEIVNKAQAYKEQRKNEAKGDVEMFNQIYARYIQGKEVTRTRMYLEVLESILPNVNKYIMDSKNSSTLIPLNDFLNGSANNPAKEATGGTTK